MTPWKYRINQFLVLDSITKTNRGDQHGRAGFRVLYYYIITSPPTRPAPDYPL